MAVKSGFFQSIDGDRPYLAEDFNGLFNEIFTEGIFRLSAESEPFAVSLNSFTEPVSLLSRERVKARSVTPRITQLGEIVVSPGYAWLNKIWIRNDSDAVYPLTLHESFSEGSTQAWKVRVYLKTDPQIRAGNIVCINGALVNTGSLDDPNLNNGFPDPVDGSVRYDIIGEVAVVSDGTTILTSAVNSLGGKKLPYVTSKITDFSPIQTDLNNKINKMDGIIYLNAYYTQAEVDTMVNDSKVRQSYFASVQIKNVLNLSTVCSSNKEWYARVLSLTASDSSNGGWHKQFAFDTLANNIYYRCSNDNLGSPASWSAWVKLADTAELGLKVAKAGDTMTGTLHINYDGYDSAITAENNAPIRIANKTGYNMSVYRDQIQVQNNTSPATLYLNPKGGNMVLSKAGSVVYSNGQLVVPAGTNNAGAAKGGIIVGPTNNRHINLFNFGAWSSLANGAPTTFYLNHWTYRQLNQAAVGTANYTHRTLLPVVIGNQLKMHVGSDDTMYKECSAIIAMPNSYRDANGTLITNLGYGCDLLFGGGGQTTMVSAGESQNYYWSTQDQTITAVAGEVLPTNTENLYLTADRHVSIVSNYQSPANRNILYWSEAGVFTAHGTGYKWLGHPTYPWARLYISPTPSSWINGHNGNSGGIYTTTKSSSTNVWLPLINGGSANGRMSLGVLSTSFMLVYATNASITASSNTNQAECTLMDESGASYFNTIKRGVWNGTAIGVQYGGTGQTSLTLGRVLIGNGTEPVMTRAITNNASNTSSIPRNDNLVTMNTLSYALNRTTALAAPDTAYSTAMARAIVATMATPSSLMNGRIHLVYS